MPCFVNPFGILWQFFVEFDFGEHYISCSILLSSEYSPIKFMRCNSRVCMVW